LSLNELGDRKPSALLRKINALKDDPVTLKCVLLLANLPSEVRSILAEQELCTVEDLARAADRIVEARASVPQGEIHGFKNDLGTTFDYEQINGLL
jgi:hypothetical protein